MTEDIHPEVLKKTQDTLGKFIKKPVLSEKLLRKPPFRFLHDICTSAMKETGFFQDTLSGSDVKVELINDKEGKIAFLQKVIAAVEVASNVKLTVKPNKIVAGHEPVKTNEFLQALALALEKQVESDSLNKAIRKVKTKTESKEEETVKRKNISNKPPQKPSEPTTEVPKKVMKKKRPNEKKSEEVKKSLERNEEDEMKKKKREKKPEVKQEKEPKKKEEKDYTATTVNGIAMDSAKDEKNIEEVIRDKQGNEDKKKKSNDSSTRFNSAKLKRTSSAKPLIIDEPPDQTLAASETLKDTEAADRVLGGVVHEEPPTTPPPPDTASAVDSHIPTVAGPTPVPKVTTPAPSPTPINTSLSGSQDGATFRPRTAIRPPSARPSSARPAAPRIRDRGQVPFQEEPVKPATGKVNLIPEQEDQLDDEELVSVQTVQETSDVTVEQVTFPTDTEGYEQHGRLVTQILEAQKELEEDIFAKKGITGRTEIEWSAGRGMEGTRREVERLRSAVQSLTRSANPLGKLLEYLQEDVDSMQQELASWRERNSSLSYNLVQERSLTDKSIEPLKAHLEELDVSIQQELQQITALKATVLRNDDKINRIFTSL